MRPSTILSCDMCEHNMLIFCVVSWPVSLLMMVGILVWDLINKPGGGGDDCE